MLHSVATRTPKQRTRTTRASDLLLVGLDLGGTLEATSAAGGDETDLLAGGAVATHGRGVTNVLMVTTTMGMLHRVHGHTTNLRAASNKERQKHKLSGKEPGVGRERGA